MDPTNRRQVLGELTGAGLGSQRHPLKGGPGGAGLGAQGREREDTRRECSEGPA